MPFVSKAQLRTCYNKHDPRWNCNEFLEHTPSICCLPEKKGKSTNKSRCMKKGERVVGKIQVGPRGGKYFTIEERDSKGKICTMKVYLSRKR